MWKYGTPGNIPPTVYFGINLDYVRDKVVVYKYTIDTGNMFIRNYKFNRLRKDISGFHLVGLIILELKEHMTCYKFEHYHWWKI